MPLFNTLMRLPFLILALLFIFSSFAQSKLADSLNYLHAIENTKTFYKQFVDPPAGLYNGGEYVDYTYDINEGHPFFESPDFKPGSVLYDGILYENVPLLYDMVTGKVVINDPHKVFKLALINERVSEFIVSTHKFVRLVKEDSEKTVITTGFYELLYSGASGVFKMKKKKIVENITISEGIRRYIVETNTYFIRKKESFYNVSSKSDLISIYKDKKKEIEQYMRNNKLSFKTNKENTLIQVTAFYDEINK